VNSTDYKAVQCNALSSLFLFRSRRTPQHFTLKHLCSFLTVADNLHRHTSYT